MIMSKVDVIKPRALELHKDFTVWDINFALSCGIEIPIKDVMKVLPAPLQPLEIRPSVCLLIVNVLSFSPETMISYDDRTDVNVEISDSSFTEITSAIAVHPKFELIDETPKLAMYLLNFGLDRVDYLKHDYFIDKLPAMTEAFKCDICSVTGSVVVSDSQGHPVFEIENIHPQPHFSNSKNVYQIFCKQKENLYYGKTIINGPIFEHQMKNSKEKKFGKLHSHPFFSNIDLDGIENQVLFFQEICPPNAKLEEYYLRLKPFNLNTA
jgi:hypothetical protein